MYINDGRTIEIRNKNHICDLYDFNFIILHNLFQSSMTCLNGCRNGGDCTGQKPGPCCIG